MVYGGRRLYPGEKITVIYMRIIISWLKNIELLLESFIIVFFI